MMSERGVLNRRGSWFQVVQLHLFFLAIELVRKSSCSCTFKNAIGSMIRI